MDVKHTLPVDLPAGRSAVHSLYTRVGFSIRGVPAEYRQGNAGAAAQDVNRWFRTRPSPLGISSGTWAGWCWSNDFAQSPAALASAACLPWVAPSFARKVILRKPCMREPWGDLNTSGTGQWA